MRYLYILIFTSLVGCSLSDDDGLPGCVVDRAKSQNSLAIYLWTASDGSQYYFLQSDCCDQFDELYDADCNYVCAPSGGFTGGGDGQCSNAILEASSGSDPLWSK